MEDPRKCVAALDDNQDDLKSIVASLKERFDTQLFEGSKDLFHYLDTETVDLLVVSAGLTKDHSLSVLADIRTRWPDIPIILTYSNTVLNQQVGEHYDMLAKATIRKPFQPEELSRLVTETIEGSPRSTLTLKNPEK